MGLRDLRKRITIGVLLPGPTSLEQIKACINRSRKVEIKYKPPSTFLNARRTAMNTTLLSGAGLAGHARPQQEVLIDVMHGTSRTQGHENALSTSICAEQQEFTFEVDLDVDVHMHFNNQDDWGDFPTTT